MFNQPASKARILAPALLAIAIPTLGYFVLHVFGTSDAWALSIAGLFACVLTLINTLRSRRLDSIGLLVALEVTLSIVIVFFTHDPRILLLRASVHAGAAGVYFLATLALERPLVYEAAKPIATRGDALRLAAYERAWGRSAEFRRMMRGLTAGWGAGLALEAVLRAWIVFHFPAARSVWMAHLPGIGILAVMAMVTRHLVTRIREIVKGEYAELSMAGGVRAGL